MTIKNLRICETDIQNPVIDDAESKKILYASISKPWLKFYNDEVIYSSLPSMSMYDYICQNAFQYLDKPALNYFDTVTSYHSLFNNIEKTATALVKHGVKKGDIVSIICPNIPEAIYLLYAINKIGAISNFIDPRTSKEGIEDYVREVNSDLVFIVDVASPKVSDLKKKCGVKTIVNISPTESMSKDAKMDQLKQMFKKSFDKNMSLEKSKFFTKKLKCSVNSFKDVINDLKNKNNVFGYSDECIQWSKFIGHYKDFILPRQSLYSDGDLPAVIVHTGGTTGRPKGVILTNNNLNYAAFDCINAGYDFKSEHNWLDIMPLFIAYGCGNALHLPLVCKSETVIIPAFEAEMMPDLLNKYHPNHMVGVPSHYGTIISSEKLANEDLSYVIAPVVGGDSMNVELEKKTNEFLAAHNCEYKIVKGYGMTEVSAAVCACTSNETNELGSVGIPFPHSVISIFDPETGDELPLTSDMNDKKIGEICISGPNVMQGYYNNETETANVMRLHDDGVIWVHSGDMGYMNEDGELFIVDRIKDLIVRHDGFKVFPKFIEEVIMKDSDVLECKVVGVNDINFIQGELPYVYVVLKDDVISMNEVLDRLSARCELELQEYSLPVGFKAVSEFPCTNIGKVDVMKLKEMANTELSPKKYVKNS